MDFYRLQINLSSREIDIEDFCSSGMWRAIDDFDRKRTIYFGSYSSLESAIDAAFQIQLNREKYFDDRIFESFDIRISIYKDNLIDDFEQFNPLQLHRYICEVIKTKSDSTPKIIWGTYRDYPELLKDQKFPRIKKEKTT